MIIEGNKYIWFELLVSFEKTQSWAVVNKSGGYHLGVILWYSGWRQYVFRSNENMEYNNSCLETITKFLTRLNTDKKIVSDSVNART